ncbi:uncharacterized protein FOMMEDRAFT_157824 [Fomitiporia mediterranea MF3/22]|uniref:uncharacterized protein n=1 Tax=Fomitiporia mediterranea (strain MF3/22) TaxID=694068 RepID=UPI000440783A|nr:uncharacterized protein FOMMEDRAFT_157824 [Fomitiporia mediterranea MF3/22]EJD00723.1 hypothetical protein FOMMEDRAFT_157824 [Fomitiporia mediterranea MF3/22]
MLDLSINKAVRARNIPLLLAFSPYHRHPTSSTYRNPHLLILYRMMYTITSKESFVLLPLESGILPFPLKRDVIETLPRFGRPEYGSEDEGELAILLVSKSVRRFSDRLSGLFRRRDHQRGVKAVLSPKVKDADGVDSDNALLWFTSADNWRPGLLPLEQAARRADIGGRKLVTALRLEREDPGSASPVIGAENETSACGSSCYSLLTFLNRLRVELASAIKRKGISVVRQVAPNTSVRIRGGQEIGIPSSPLKCDTIDALPRFGEPEYRFEDEGELATPFISESVPRLTDHLVGVQRCAARSQGHPHSSCFSICHVSLNVTYRFRVAFPLIRDATDVLPRNGKPAHGFESEGELATPLVSKSVPRLSDRLSGVFRRRVAYARYHRCLPRNGKPQHGFESGGELATPLISKSVPRLSDRLSGVSRRRDPQRRVTKVDDASIVNSDSRLTWFTIPVQFGALGPDDSDSASPEVGTDNMRRVPVPLLVTIHNRQLESNASTRVRDEVWTRILSFPPKCDTINALLRFGKPEHGFENEGELATPFVIKSVSRFSIRLSGVFVVAITSAESSHPQTYARYHRRISWVSKPEYGFEDEGDPATPFVSESVPRLSDRLIGVFRRAARNFGLLSRLYAMPLMSSSEWEARARWSLSSSQPPAWSKGHPQSSCFSICRVSLNVPYRVRVTFPLVWDTIEAFPRSDKPEYGVEDEDELATPLVSKPVQRSSNRVAGAFQRRNYHHRVQTVFQSRSTTRTMPMAMIGQCGSPVEAFERVSVCLRRLGGWTSFLGMTLPEKRLEDSDSASPVVWRQVSIGYCVFTIDRLSRMRAPEYKMNSKPGFCLSRLNTTPSMSSPRVRKPEHGFEDEGELATPFVSRTFVGAAISTKSRSSSLPGLQDPDSASLVVGTDIEPSTRISTYSNPLIFLYRFGVESVSATERELGHQEIRLSPFPLIRDIFNALPRSRRSEYGFEDEGELATPLISKLVPRFSDRIAGAFCHPDHQRLVKVIVSTKVSDADDVSSDDKLTWLTSPNNWCPGLLPFERLRVVLFVEGGRTSFLEMSIQETTRRPGSSVGSDSELSRLSRMQASGYEVGRKPGIHLSCLYATPSTRSCASPCRGFPTASPELFTSYPPYQVQGATDVNCDDRTRRPGFSVDSSSRGQLETSTRVSTCYSSLMFICRFGVEPASPEHGFESEGELATLLVSKSVPRISDRLSGLFRRRDHQCGVKVVLSRKVKDANDVDSDNALLWFTSADNWRPGLLPLEQAARRADIVRRPEAFERV